MAKYLDEVALSELVTNIKNLVATKQNVLTQGTGISITTSGSTTTISVDADSSPTQSSSKPVTSGGVYSALSNKQDTLTFDTTPTSSSTNPVTSGGIYNALIGNGISSLTDKGLSENDYTDAEKTKLGGIASGAQVNTIESVKSGSTTFTITNKAVDIQSVDNLTNYYTTANTYNKTEIDSLIGGIKTITYSIVSSLPTADSTTYFGNSKTIYMVRNTAQSGSDYYEEYITIRTGTDPNYTYSWEKIGDTQIDLSNYVPITRTVNGKALSADITINVSDLGSTGANTAYNKNFETSTSNIKMDGTASVGSLSTIARADHVHPHDTSKQDVLTSANAGANVTISTVNNVLTISATDTTYTSESAAQGGTTVSLVTTGEKYIWNNKQDAMTAITTAEVDALFA